MDSAAPNPKRPLENTRSVLDLVEEQAGLRPGAEAVRAGSLALSYEALASRGHRIAAHLHAMGIGPEVAVGLCVKSSPAMVAGALGIFEAGAAYVPMDPVHPPARLATLARDAAVPVILATRQSSSAVPPGPWDVIQMDDDGMLRGVPERIGARPEAVLDPTILAYVIFTSGSTGQPKGVEVEHGSLLNLVRWHLRAFSVTAADRASLLAGVAFDAAVWEVWPYLAAGASLHVPDERVRVDAPALQGWLLRERITIAFAPTALAEQLMELSWPEHSSLRVLLTGGDTLHRRPRASLPFRVVNNYGPTEGTVVSTSGTVTPDGTGAERPSIGRTIDGVRAYVLDADLRDVPPGALGELYVAGAGVARGYRNRPDLTAERFLPDPHDGGGGGRMYRTGDLVSALPGGEIAFAGRADQQIQLRGHRIEPDEICAALNLHPAVVQSAVIARGEGAERELVAYVTLVPGAVPGRAELREHLAATLPEPMVPALFVEVEALPLTPNGKRDLKALPEPSPENVLADRPRELPASPVQEQVASILADLLHVPAVGVRENFFHLGGHSLLGAQMIARLSESFGVDLSLRALFDHPTVEDLSAEIERAILAAIDARSASTGSGLEARA